VAVPGVQSVTGQHDALQIKRAQQRLEGRRRWSAAPAPVSGVGPVAPVAGFWRAGIPDGRIQHVAVDVLDQAADARCVRHRPQAGKRVAREAGKSQDMLRAGGTMVRSIRGVAQLAGIVPVGRSFLQATCHAGPLFGRAGGDDGSLFVLHPEESLTEPIGSTP
jgi:hypothetical protein